jgi:hypothetical protein
MLNKELQMQTELNKKWQAKYRTAQPITFAAVKPWRIFRSWSY